MKKIIIFAGIVVLGLTIYLFQRGTNEAPNVTNSPSPTVSSTPSVLLSPTSMASPIVSATTKPYVSPSPITTPTVISNVKTFTVVGRPFSFTPSEITVNKGDTVKIIFQNSSGNHDWRLDEFNARTNVISGGESETIQFVADKMGTFEYYCSVGTHRLMGMKGTLVVK
ncbi:MAG: cupredoxin domain-containing protein [Patescibacteria group bacterium]